MQVNWLAPKAGSKLLIVGGCGGIGRSLVESALANDLQVAVFDLARSIEERPLPQGALAFDLDASNVQATDAAMAKLATQWPLLDGLVTLAGFMGQPYPEELFIPEKQEVKSMKHQASGSERNPTAGITRKSFLKLEGFLRKAGVDPTTVCEVRCIGTDDEMVRAIIERIAIGEKTMTYSLPWIAEHECRDAPVTGLHVVVLDADRRS